MPDPYGISAALHTALQIFESTSRASGRTSRMLAGLKPGDTITVITVQGSKAQENKQKRGTPGLSARFPGWYRY